MGRRARALLLLTAALVVSGVVGAVGAGCSPSPEGQPITSDAGYDAGPFVPDPCKASLAAGKTATVSIGQGQTFYLDVADDAVLEWEKGPQGGHHIWVALRQKGLRMLGTILVIDIHDVNDPANEKLINHSQLIYGFDRDEGGYCTLTGLRMQLDNAGIDLSQLNMHRMRIDATLRDPDGATATATKYVKVTGIID